MTVRHSILFVDDDREFRKTMKKVFERRGYDFTGAADGTEALDLLSKNTFDLIISDLRMPNLNGVGLMEELRRRSIDLPVIFLTAYGEVESYMDLMNMGAFDYLNKPVSAPDMLRVVKRALETQKSRSV
jgi:DNA-binding NtrC family response regulator